MKYVIVGNGVASVGAIESIRQKDKSGEILVISDESVPTYGRPLISYFLSGKVGMERMSLRPEDFYEKHKVSMKLGAKAVKLNAQAKTVTLENGEDVSYDKLLIATGGTPFRPPIKGVEGEGIYSFTTLEHAEELLECAKRIKKAVVVGGGLIGLKAAEGLRDCGIDVTIVELAPRVLSAAFDDEAGGLVAKRLIKEGIGIKASVSVDEITRGPDGGVTGVKLSSGEVLDCEAVVVAIGVVPNKGLAEGAGLTVNRGIVVDDHMQTSAEDVYAAGDVAEAMDMLAGENRVTPIWPNAYNQARTAGKNMAGGDEAYTGGLAMNSIAFYGLATCSVGEVNPQNPDAFETFKFLDEEKQVYRKLVFKDNVLRGYVLVGDIDLAGTYTGFIRFAFPLDNEKKALLKKGEASPLLWPEDFFEQTWEAQAKVTV